MVPSPKEDKIKNKPNDMTVQKYHSFFRHLKLSPDNFTSTRPRIAKHHFHYRVVSDEGTVPSTVDRHTGGEIGLTNVDRNKQSKSDKDFYIVRPNCSIAAAEMLHDTFLDKGKSTLVRKSQEMANEEAEAKELERGKKRQKLETAERDLERNIHSQLDEKTSKLLVEKE